MDCLTFLDRLAALLDGRAAPGERAALEEHARACADCGDLLRAAETQSRTGSVAPGPARGEEPFGTGFVGDVLRRTTGPACRRAEDLLPDFADGLLDAGTASLVASHLAHCAACAALAETLRAMGPVLASLAEVEPGPDLLVSVLDATSRRPKERVGSGFSRIAGWQAWVAGWSELLLSRPRLSLEAAYIGTVLFVLVFGNPAATLHAASARTVAVAETGIGRVKTALPSALASLPGDQRVAGALTTVEDLRQKLAMSPGSIVPDLGSAIAEGRADATWWRGIVARLSGAWTAVRDTVGWLVEQAGARAARVRDALQSLFSRPTEPPRPASR
jgi:anti-sigma factor RsiW